MDNKKISVETLTEEFLKCHYDNFLYLEREWVALGDRPWNQEKFLSELPDKWEMSSYASEGDKIVGYAIISSIPKNNQAYLRKILVDRECIGKGVGSLLLNETIRKCTEKGIEKLIFKVRTNAKSAIKLYEKFNVKFLDKEIGWDGGERYLCELPIKKNES